jgi:glycerophosphoryl diester phosphodiesterase
MRGLLHPALADTVAGPIAFAHRGGAKEAPENSRAAFRHSVALGYRFIETDARASADGVVMLNHDATLDRTSDSHGLIRQLDHAELKSVHVGGEPLMTLDEALDEYSHQVLNIDCKDDHTLEPLIRTLRHRGEQVFERIIVGSFSQRRLDHLRMVFGPRLATSCGPAELAALMGAARGLPLPRPSAHVVAAQVPLRFRGVRVFSERLVERAHRAGLQVHVWTIDDSHVMRSLFDMGVDGIVSDRPTLLRAVIAERSNHS